MKFNLILFSFFVFIHVFGQTATDGDALFVKKKYSKALKVYEALIRKKPTDALYNYRLGICYAETKDLENAITYLKKSTSKNVQKELYLADALYKTYRFSESLIAYRFYLSTLKPENPAVEELTKTIQKVERASKLLTKVEDIGIVDSILVNKSDFMTYYKTSVELGSLSQHQLRLSARKTVDKIIYTTQRKDRVYYSDTLNEQVDLFTSYKLLDEWSKPSPLPATINTAANENYPFLLLDGITLYFASDGENSLGGYDLFITRYAPATDTYLAPENLGFPFNSPSNDYMMVIDEHRKLGWFATDRSQQAGKVMIYTFVPNKTKQIFRSPNVDSIRYVAQLKLYRKVPKTIADSTMRINQQLSDSAQQMAFEINDSIVYTNVSQFRSDNARKLWNEMAIFSNDLIRKNLALKSLRLKYESAETPQDKDKLVNEIVELESGNVEAQKQYSLKILEIRNVENKAINSN